MYFAQVKAIPQRRFGCSSNNSCTVWNFCLLLAVPVSQLSADLLPWQEDWDAVSSLALRLFEFGQQEAAKRDLLLVDTKYEFGKDSDGRIMLIDEVHTPDSSRYWLADTYAARHAEGREPQNIDKEFLRLWFKDRCVQSRLERECCCCCCCCFRSAGTRRSRPLFWCCANSCINTCFGQLSWRIQICPTQI